MPAASTMAQRTPLVPKSKPKAQASPAIGESTRGMLGVIVAIATLQLATKSIFSRDTASVGDRFSVRAVGIPAMSLLENTVLSTQSHKPQKGKTGGAV